VIGLPWEDYIEKELISKRFLIATVLLTIFGYTVITNNEAGMTAMAGIVGSVVGFYFGTKNQTVEVVQG